VKAAAKVRLLSEKRKAKSEEFAPARHVLTFFIGFLPKNSQLSILNSQLFRTSGLAEGTFVRK